MPKKYDTNPLDPEFPKRVEQQMKAAVNGHGMPTQTLPPPSVTEEETRRFNFDAANMDPTKPYPSVFAPPPAVVNQPRTLVSDKDAVKPLTNRSVAGLGLPESLVMGLPYIPFGVGLVASIITLLLVPRGETRVRFHAAQGLAIHIGVLVVGAIVKFLGFFSDWANFGLNIFYMAVLVFLIVSMVKVWQGKPHHVEAVEDLTEWLEEKLIMKK